MSRPTRWVTETKPGHSQWYIERFRTMAAEGADLGGEARLVDAMVPPRSRILDAGCGPGRVGAVLHERGHTVVGVDVDPELIAGVTDDAAPHKDVDGMSGGSCTPTPRSPSSGKTPLQKQLDRLCSGCRAGGAARTAT